MSIQTSDYHFLPIFEQLRHADDPDLLGFYLCYDDFHQVTVTNEETEVTDLRMLWSGVIFYLS
jgi:hypothetical protein